MHLGVCDQIALPGKSFSTHSASKRCLARMKPHMSQKSSLLQELLPAGRTSMRNPAMKSPMINQLKLPLKGRSAIRAHERMKTPMEPRVHSKMILLREALPALSANKRSLPRMKFTVRYQMPLKRKRSPALLTYKRSLPRVYTRVRHQMMFKCEGLLALATLIRSLRGMKKEMRVKTMFMREALPAVDAYMRSLPRVYTRVSRKVMFKKKRLSAFRTGIRSLLRNSRLTSHVLLLDLCINLRGINMSQNMPKMTILSLINVVRSLIRRGCCALH